jgi:hypothetical protein
MWVDWILMIAIRVFALAVAFIAGWACRKSAEQWKPLQPTELAAELLSPGTWFLDAGGNLMRAGDLYPGEEWNPDVFTRACFNRFEDIVEIEGHEIVTPIYDAEEILRRLFEPVFE